MLDPLVFVLVRATEDDDLCFAGLPGNVLISLHEALNVEETPDWLSRLEVQALDRAQGMRAVGAADGVY